MGGLLLLAAGVFFLRMYTHADQESIRRASQIFRNAIKEA